LCVIEYQLIYQPICWQKQVCCLFLFDVRRVFSVRCSVVIYYRLARMLWHISNWWHFYFENPNHSASFRTSDCQLMWVGAVVRFCFGIDRFPNILKKYAYSWTIDKKQYRSVAYSVELVLLNKHQIYGGAPKVNCYRKLFSI